MSGADSEFKFAYGDSATNACAADWVIARRESGDWSEARQSELNAWLARSPAHAVAYLRIDAAWSRADRLNALRPAGGPHFRERAPLLVRIAAAFAGLVIVGIVAIPFLYLHESARVYSTAVGGRTTITLNDGTEIELNTDSQVRISDNARERKLWLDRGEAYFDVRHDSVHPLVLLIGDHRVVDIGTKFIARREGSQARIAVDEGSVLFEPAASDKQLTLVPGDVLVATSKSVSVSRKSAQDLAIELGWRSGVVTFKHTTLADAAAELNRYDTKKIVVADSAARSMTISGTFPVGNETLFAQLVNAGLGLRVEDRAQGIVITSK